MFLLTALLACQSGSDVRTADTGDTGLRVHPAFDTADSGEPDTAPPRDTGEALPPGPFEPVGEACYLGPDRAHDVCAALVSPDPPSGYDYPAPLNGNDNYRAPVAWLDLDHVPPELAVAPNFALDELAQAHKGRLAVVQPHAVARLQDVRDDLGPIVVNSGYRSPDYNAGVDGATWSRHMYGDAFDLRATQASLADLAASCEDHGAGYVGWYETHIHCDWRDDPVHTGFFGEARRAVVRTARPVLDATVVAHDGVLRAPATGWDEGEPLREWRALDADGRVVHRAVGRTYAPPARAASVIVTVGRAIERRATLEPR